MKKIILGANVIFVLAAFVTTSVFPVSYVAAQVPAPDVDAGGVPRDGITPGPDADAGAVPRDGITPAPDADAGAVPRDGITPAPDATADEVANQAPVITITPNPITIVVGRPFADSMVSVTATDEEDGSITDITIVSDEVVKTDAIGSYSRVYSVVDSMGVTNTATRIVKVVAGPAITPGPGAGAGAIRPERNTPPIIPAPDATVDVANRAPVISFSQNPVTVVVGGTFTEPTVTVTDDEEANLTPVILSDNTVNTGTIGSYIRIYTATDSGGLTTMAERVVNVVADNSNNNGGGNGGGGSGGGRSSRNRNNNNNSNGSNGQVLGASTGPGLVLGASDFQFLTDMGRGMTSNDVMELQKRLRAEGYFVYPENTGYFGPFTQIAVMLYQIAHGVTPWATGFAGPLTRADLNAR